jgi:F-type H+-transporting ATPase subunit delta
LILIPIIFCKIVFDLTVDSGHVVADLTHFRLLNACVSARAMIAPKALQKVCRVPQPAIGTIKLFVSYQDEGKSLSSGATGLAGRYAGALYALADDTNSLNEIVADLTDLAKLVGENDDMKMLISSPALTRGEQQAGITAITQKAGAHALTVKFLGTLAENGRLFVLPKIISVFLDEHARRQGQISAEVVSAVTLDASRKASVEKAVASLAGSDKLSLSMRVDPSLIGGLVVRIGSRMIDTSIKTKLSRLETAMKGVA